MKLKALATLLFCLAATGAYANDKGMYLGVGVGQFNIEIDDIQGTADFDADDNVYKIFGGYRFSPFFGVELAYIDLGSAEDMIGPVNVQAEINGFAPYAVVTLPLGPIELSARLGYYFYDVKVKGSGGGFSASSSDSSEDLVYGIGIGLTLFDKLNARLEYEEVDIDGADGSNAIWLSGAWRF